VHSEGIWDLLTTTPKNQNSKHIMEIPVITLTSRGGLGDFLSTFKMVFFGRGKCAFGVSARMAEKPFLLLRV
jgi:hypothetical protein